MTEEEYQLELSTAAGHLYLGNGVDALETVTRMPHPDKGRREAQRIRVMALLVEEEWGMAEWYAKRMLDLNPHAAEFWMMMASAQAEQERMDDARESLKRALELDPAIEQGALLSPSLRWLV